MPAGDQGNHDFTTGGAPAEWRGRENFPDGRRFGQFAGGGPRGEAPPERNLAGSLGFHLPDDATGLPKGKDPI